MADIILKKEQKERRHKLGKLENKVAVVTGSGRGIGKAVAVLFAREGASVVVSDIDETPAKEVASEIEAGGGIATVCVADVRKPEGTNKLMNTAVGEFGKLDILVNNAGITRDALINRMTDMQWDICLDINLKGTFNCIRSASRYMMKKGHGGRVINIVSIVGMMGNLGQINYTAAKSGVIGLTKTVAREWSRFGITCNAVAYGFVDTRLTREKEGGEEALGERLGLPKRVRDQLLQQTQRAIPPEAAARPVLFLASEDAAFITGHVLNVSDGQYI